MAASSEQKSEYVCTLSDELIQKAEQELNEKPQWRSRDIQALRDMLEKRPGKGKTMDVRVGVVRGREWSAGPAQWKSFVMFACHQLVWHYSDDMVWCYTLFQDIISVLI